MKLLIDMNLSPLWVDALEVRGFAAIHWSQVGDPKAPDQTILEWARREGCVVFTHDLDFARLLALTHATGPSVVQLRSQSVLPGGSAGPLVYAALQQHGVLLERGALVVIDAATSRARILPIGPE